MEKLENARAAKRVRTEDDLDDCFSLETAIPLYIVLWHITSFVPIRGANCGVIPAKHTNSKRPFAY